MSNRLDDAVGLVKAYLEENNYSYSITMSNLRCFRLFKAYLEKKKKTYSNTLAIQWFNDVSMDCAVQH